MSLGRELASGFSRANYDRALKAAAAKTMYHSGLPGRVSTPGADQDIYPRRSDWARGGLNLYGYAGGDPVNFADPFGLKADTLEVTPAAKPMVDECKAKSTTCKREVEILERSTEVWRVEVGAPGSCLPYFVGCTAGTPGVGGTVTIIPGEFRRGARALVDRI